MNSDKDPEQKNEGIRNDGTLEIEDSAQREVGNQMNDMSVKSTLLMHAFACITILTIISSQKIAAILPDHKATLRMKINDALESYRMTPYLRKVTTEHITYLRDRDPDNGEYPLLQGELDSISNYNLPKALNEYQSALELNKNHTGLHNQTQDLINELLGTVENHRSSFNNAQLTIFKDFCFKKSDLYKNCTSFQSEPHIAENGPRR